MTQFQHVHKKIEIKRDWAKSLTCTWLGMFIVVFAMNGNIAIGMEGAPPVQLAFLGILNASGNLEITGDSNVPGHEQEIVVQNFAFGSIENEFRELQVRKFVDSASPELAVAAVIPGPNLSKVILTLLADGEDHMTVTLENVRITHVGVEHTAGSAVPLEMVSLIYSKATWRVDSEQACYDLIERRVC